MENRKLTSNIAELKKLAAKSNKIIRDLEAIDKHYEYIRELSLEELKDLIEGNVVSGILDDYYGLSLRLNNAEVFVDLVHKNINIHDAGWSLKITISESYIEDIYVEKNNDIVIDFERAALDLKLILHLEKRKE